MNLPELTRDERAALAFLMRTAAKFGPDKCWPKTYSIGVAIGKSKRTASRVMTALTAFGIIERIERGPESNRYTFLLNAEQLTGIIGVAFRKDGVAFGAALENHAKVKEIRLVKPRKSHAIGAASPSLCPPTPRRSPMSQMPEMYANDPAAQKLWRMAQRWIAENKPPFITALDYGPIMRLLEKAGALTLPEDGPLPAIAWPPEATAQTPARKPTSTVGFFRELQRQKLGGDDGPSTIERKPMALAESDLVKLKRQIGGEK